LTTSAGDHSPGAEPDLSEPNPWVVRCLAIRDHPLANDGLPVHTSAIADPDDANGTRVYSLRPQASGKVSTWTLTSPVWNACLSAMKKHGYALYRANNPMSPASIESANSFHPATTPTFAYSIHSCAGSPRMSLPLMEHNATPG